MRSLVSSSVMVFALAAGLAAQNGEMPLFRSGVELLEVDVSVVSDSTGDPLTDLLAGDFTVLVDGQPRTVVSSEYLSDIQVPAGSPSGHIDPSISTNQDQRVGRQIVLVLDQNNMTLDRVRGMTSSALRFIDGLAPTDRVALMGIPAPGPQVDFTTDREQVKRALSSLRGYSAAERLEYNISDYEALSFDLRSDPAEIGRLMDRLCAGQDPATRPVCEGEVSYEARQLAQIIRHRTIESVSALSAVLTRMQELPGSKSMILMSSGLNLEAINQDPATLLQLAAAGRVTMNVMIFEREIWSSTDRFAPPQTLRDRMMRQGGLEILGLQSRGAFFNVVANPSAIFNRIRSEMAGHYLLGVESLPRDRDGRRHAITVRTRRRDVNVRARQEFLYRAGDANPDERAVIAARVLRSPIRATDFAMQVTTYCFRDEHSDGVRVVIAAEIDPPTGGAADISVSHVFYDRLGKGVAAGEERKVYPDASGQPLLYATSRVLPPGTYRLRVAAIDAAGFAASVEREVQVWRMSGQRVSIGDLMLAGDGRVRRDAIRPAVLAKASGEGVVRAMTEVYGATSGALDRAGVTFEIADDADAPALRSAAASYHVRPNGLSGQRAQDLNVGMLPPGRYVVRAIVRDGDAIIGKLVRPFTLVAPSTPSSAGLVELAPAPFARESVVSGRVLNAALDIIDAVHPLAKGATARARSGHLAGSSMAALEAGDQIASDILHALETLDAGDANRAAQLLGGPLRSPRDSVLASFYLAACYAAGGRDLMAIANWDRARTAGLAVPDIPLLMAEAWLRQGKPEEAVPRIAEILKLRPGDEAIRKKLAMTQAVAGQPAGAYATIAPFLASHPSDPDALLVALQAIYQIRLAGTFLESHDADNKRAVAYADAYRAAGGSHAAIVDKWIHMLAVSGAALN